MCVSVYRFGVSDQRFLLLIFFLCVSPSSVSLFGGLFLDVFPTFFEFLKLRTDYMASELANGIMTNGLDNGQSASDKVVYKKDLTVCVELVGENKTNVAELLRCTRELCGGLLACRYTGINKYELTMSHPKGKERLLEGFKIGQTRVMAHELNNDELVVSFLGLPAYVTDEDILRKLESWKVSATTPIRRRMWPGTRIADGTRFLRVRFNDQVQSLPYSTKFDTALGPEYFRVIHDRQVKVCRICIQPGHILRECPDFSCHRCGIQGHYARECGQRDNKCNVCKNHMKECVCNRSEGEEDASSESEGEMVGNAYEGGSDHSVENGEGGMEILCRDDSSDEADESLSCAQAHGQARGTELGSRPGVTFDVTHAEPERGNGGTELVSRPEPPAPPGTIERTSQSAAVTIERTSPSATISNTPKTPARPQPPLAADAHNNDSGSEMDVVQTNVTRKRQASEWKMEKKATQKLKKKEIKLTK